MKRRSFLKACAMSSLGMYAAPALAQRAGKPNLLIIHTDEHNFRTLGCYRNTLPPDQAFVWGKDAFVETPNIDWIAENGALCTKFYATSPVCSPSRASFVSGLYPHTINVPTNDWAMDDNVVTFASVLAANGYETGYAGKWHLDGTGKPQWVPERNFGFEDNKYMFNRGHWKKLADTPNGPKVDTGDKPTYDVAGADNKSYTTDFLTDRAIAFMERNRAKPFVFMLSIPDPHSPDTVRRPYTRRYEKMKFETPRTAMKKLEDAPSWAKPEGPPLTQHRYFGMVKCIDHNVGKLISCLKENNLIDNTIVVFTSDHGDMCGEHGRQNKGIPLEASARVPFLIYYKAKIRKGTIVRQSLGCVDFLPTILSLMGVITSVKVAGRDASELFKTGISPLGWKDITFMRSAGEKDRGWLCAATSRYKLVLSSRDEPWLLDLEQDPDELKNFRDAAGYRGRVKSLAQALKTYATEFKDPRIRDPRIAADLKWCASGTGAYRAPAISAPPSTRGKSRRGRRRRGR